MDFSSIAEFVDFLIEDDRLTFTCEELHSLRVNLGIPIEGTHALRVTLESAGLELENRQKARNIRTFSSSNDHDRWNGPGSSPTHGGSGWENIVRMIK